MGGQPRTHPELDEELGDGPVEDGLVGEKKCPWTRRVNGDLLNK